MEALLTLSFLFAWHFFTENDKKNTEISEKTTRNDSKRRKFLKKWRKKTKRVWHSALQLQTCRPSRLFNLILESRLEMEDKDYHQPLSMLTLQKEETGNYDRIAQLSLIAPPSLSRHFQISHDLRNTTIIVKYFFGYYTDVSIFSPCLMKVSNFVPK